MRLVVEDGERLARLPEVKLQGVVVAQAVVPAGGVEVSGQHGEEGGLSAPVGAGDREVLAALDLQVQRADVRRSPGPGGGEIGHNGYSADGFRQT